jgi:hypothetical protein
MIPGCLIIITVYFYDMLASSEFGSYVAKRSVEFVIVWFVG